MASRQVTAATKDPFGACAVSLYEQEIAMLNSRIMLVALAFVGSVVGAASAEAGASTGSWKYSPRQIHRYQAEHRGYYSSHRYGYRHQPYRYGYYHHDRGHHYGWNRGRDYGWDQRYYR